MRAGGWRNRRAGGVRQIRGSCGRWTSAGAAGTTQLRLWWLPTRT